MAEGEPLDEGRQPPVLPRALLWYYYLDRDLFGARHEQGMLTPPGEVLDMCDHHGVSDKRERQKAMDVIAAFDRGRVRANSKVWKDAKE